MWFCINYNFLFGVYLMQGCRKAEEEERAVCTFAMRYIVAQKSCPTEAKPA